MEVTILHKRGDVREDGKIFWGYCSRYKSGEYWTIKEKVDEWLEKNKISKRERYQRLSREEPHGKFMQGVRRRLTTPAYKEYLKIYGKKYRKDPAVREKILRLTRNWKRRPENRIKAATYIRNRYQADPSFRLKGYLRSRLYHILKLKGMTKSDKTETFLGCSIDFLWIHLSWQLRNGMTRENYGKVWHIDHYIPLSSAKTIEDIKELFHWTNLQPLSGPENLKKGSKMPWELICGT